MKLHYILLIALSSTLSYAQMPTSMGSGSSSNGGQAPKIGSGVQSSDEEPTNPQIFGTEVPLLDPATNQVSYNGGKFDVGNNAIVRARFEKYLQQVPDTSEEALRYRAIINKMIDFTEKNSKTKAVIGSEILSKIGRELYAASDFPADGRQSSALAAAIISALNIQRGNRGRSMKNKLVEKEILKHSVGINKINNTNSTRAGAPKSDKGGASMPRNLQKAAFAAAEMLRKRALQGSNDATNVAALGAAKIAYQALLAIFVAQRRFDHAVIGASSYRHIFRDGDTKINMNKDSEGARFFDEGSGFPPTVQGLESFANNARYDVVQSIEAVHSLLAQNKLSDATQHLIQAVAIGEYMESVTTFPVKARMRIAAFWQLRKQILVSLNARDYGRVEEIAAKMREQDVDFDDSFVRSMCKGRMLQSNLALRNAFEALKKNDQVKFNEQIKISGIIWPLNPNLDKGIERLEELDNKEPEKKEFTILYKRNDYRTIFDEQERFEIVAFDPELKKNYKEVLTLIGTIDAMLAQLDEVAKQDKRMGPCAAYETLLEKGKENPKFLHDSKFVLAQLRYENLASDFVRAIKDGAESEKRQEIGSALANYQRALCIYPQSKHARKASNRLVRMIIEAKY